MNPKYIQFVGDAILPIAGFFFWDWSLYFIILFYFIDVFVSEIVSHLKSKRIYEYKGGYIRKRWIINGLVSGVFLASMIFAVHIGLWLLFPDIHFLQEIVSFWTYTEMGIQQGYVLVPLLAFGAYQEYKMSFLRTEKFKTEQLSDLWRPQMFGYLLAILASFVVGILGSFVYLPEVVIVLATILGVSIFRLFKA